MARRIARTAQADEDLIEIWSYIATDSLDAADRVLDAIESRWQQLARYPHFGPARDDILPGLRQLTSGQYLILYSVQPDKIEIVRVVHGRRKIDRDLLE